MVKGFKDFLKDRAEIAKQENIIVEQWKTSLAEQGFEHRNDIWHRTLKGKKLGSVGMTVNATKAKADKILIPGGFETRNVGKYKWVYSGEAHIIVLSYSKQLNDYIIYWTLDGMMLDG